LTHVASVAGRRIERSRLEERLRRFRAGPAGRHLAPDAHTGDLLTLRRWLLQDLVTEAILAHEARAAGLAADDGATSGAPALGATVIRALFEAVTADVRVGEDELRAYYARNVDRYRTPEGRRIRQWILDTEATARRVRDQIAARATAGLDDASDARGSQLELHRGEFAGPLEEAIFAAEPGEIVGPIRTELGWHVALVEAISREHTAAYDAVRSHIETELLAAARGRVFAEWLERRRRELVTVERGWEHPADPVHGVISHRH
jgi:[acyl-carrier-protein] S-malonyltransferase